MKNPPESNRRDLLLALSAFAALGSQAAAQETLHPPPTAGNPNEPLLSHSHAFPFDRLPVKPSPNGGASRAVIQGALPTGEFVEIHETALPPGQMPHPPHKHRHSEFMLIREGTLEFDNDGTLEHLGPGGVAFCASMVMHGLKNIGPSTAHYFVVAIGRESAVTPV